MAGFSLTVALAQIAPVWLDRAATLAKVNSYVEQAARQGCGLVAFGEALVPGYPFWLELTDGARFNSPLQKTIFAEYASQAVQPESGHLDEICATAARNRIAVYLGCVERAADRGAHSLLLFARVYRSGRADSLDSSQTDANLRREARLGRW
jgi:nitrilase